MRVCRMVKSRDEVNARMTKQAIEAKLPYLLQFLANADDDVSGTIAPFAHDYVTMLKQTVPLSDQQKEFVKVQTVCCIITAMIAFTDALTHTITAITQMQGYRSRPVLLSFCHFDNFSDNISAMLHTYWACVDS